MVSQPKEGIQCHAERKNCPVSIFTASERLRLLTGFGDGLYRLGIASRSSRISILGAGGTRSGPGGSVPILSSSAPNPSRGFSEIQSESASMRMECDPFAFAASRMSSNTVSKTR